MEGFDGGGLVNWFWLGLTPPPRRRSVPRPRAYKLVPKGFVSYTSDGARVGGDTLQGVLCRGLGRGSEHGAQRCLCRNAVAARGVLPTRREAGAGALPRDASICSAWWLLSGYMHSWL